MNDETNEEITEETGTTHEDLLKELALVEIMHALTGKIDAPVLKMLLQTAILADILVRQKEDKDKATAALLTDLQAESFAKDIEIATLRAQLEDRAL